METLAAVIKDWLWRRIWYRYRCTEHWPENACRCDWDAEHLDPQAIFEYQVTDKEHPFTMFHFIAHMSIMRESLPYLRYAAHRRWVFKKYPQHVPGWRKLLLSAVCAWLLPSCVRENGRRQRTTRGWVKKEERVPPQRDKGEHRDDEGVLI